MDYASSVAQAGARKSWSPAWLWDYATGGDEVPPVVEVDEDALAAYLAARRPGAHRAGGGRDPVQAQGPGSPIR